MLKNSDIELNFEIEMTKDKLREMILQIEAAEKVAQPSQVLRMKINHNTILVFRNLYKYNTTTGTSFGSEAKLENKNGKDLYKFWKNKITDYIIKELETHESKVLLNLASSEYLKCIDLKPIKKDFKFIDVVFKDYDLKTNTYKVKGLYAKKARGYMCRFIIKNKIDSVDGLLKFNMEGYTYNDELSNGEVITFTRKNI